MHTDGRDLVGQMTGAIGCGPIGRRIAMEATTIDEIHALLKERPGDAELHQQLGSLYFESGELTKAWEAYMQALRLDPDDPFTCLLFGNLLTLCDDRGYALTLFEHAAKVAPDLAVVHWCLGKFYRDVGRYEDAGREYERAVEVEPDNPQAREKFSEWSAFIAAARDQGCSASE
jgi:cytochrome c-type biogenesis protein CcmH/NrfG